MRGEAVDGEERRERPTSGLYKLKGVYARVVRHCIRKGGSVKRPSPPQVAAAIYTYDAAQEAVSPLSRTCSIAAQLPSDFH